MFPVHINNLDQRTPEFCDNDTSSTVLSDKVTLLDLKIHTALCILHGLLRTHDAELVSECCLMSQSATLPLKQRHLLLSWNTEQ